MHGGGRIPRDADLALTAAGWRRQASENLHGSTTLGRITTWAIVGAAIVVLTLVAYWAGRTTVLPPDDPLASASEPVTYEVIEQTLGRSLQFAAVAEWAAFPLVRAQAPGIVTTIGFEPGTTVDSGDVLFTVDLRPVVIAEGAIPSFRDMQTGDEGSDVRQLQALLAELGFFAERADGQFGAATERAVRAWQASLGMAADGIVRRGDMAFASELPVRVAATDALTVGAPLNGGEVLLNGLATAPTFVVPLTPEQRDLVPLSGSVVITYPEGTRAGVIARTAESVEDGSGTLDLVIEAAGGGPPCGENCAEWVPPTGRTDFGVEIVVVPETTGPVIPVAAIATDPGGKQTVQLVDGTQVAVDVKVSTGGLAVVRGLNTGDVVVLPFTEPSSD